MASPVVTGVVALMLTANPTLSVAEVKSILYAEADPIADPTLGAGRVNAKDSVAAALAALSVRATNMTLQSSLSLTTRDETTLTPSFTPGNASNQYAVWTSSNENVVTVRSGVLTALTNGSAVITATSVDGGHTDTCVVTVSGLVESVSLSASTHTMDVDDSFTLTETVLPADATNKTVSWSSSNTAVATVSNGVVQGVGGGSATITATTDDGGFTATCNVTVMKAVEGVGVSPGWAEICVGDTYSFSPLISPSDATNKNVSWTSSNTAVATVSSSGKVTAKAKGTAQITVETDDGGFIDSSTVDVFYSEIKSSVYTASQSAGLLLGVDLDTTADALKANLQNTTSKLSVLTSAGAAVSGGSDVATGNVARLTVDDTVRDELSVVIRGECTGDAAINIGDYTVVRLDILDLKKLSGAYLEAADVNDDGVVNIGDYTLIRLHILGLKPLY